MNIDQAKRMPCFSGLKHSFPPTKEKRCTKCNAVNPRANSYCTEGQFHDFSPVDEPKTTENGAIPKDHTTGGLVTPSEEQKGGEVTHVCPQDEEGLCDNCPCHEESLKEGWRKDFAKLWRDGENRGYDTYDPMVAFIEKLLAQERAAGYEERKKEIWDELDDLSLRIASEPTDLCSNSQEFRSKVVKLLEAMKKRYEV